MLYNRVWNKKYFEIIAFLNKKTSRAVNSNEKKTWTNISQLAAAKSNILLNFPALDVFLLQLAEISNIFSSSVPSYLHNPEADTILYIPIW